MYESFRLVPPLMVSLRRHTVALPSRVEPGGNKRASRQRTSKPDGCESWDDWPGTQRKRLGGMAFESQQWKRWL